MPVHLKTGITSFLDECFCGFLLVAPFFNQETFNSPPQAQAIRGSLDLLDRSPVWYYCHCNHHHRHRHHQYHHWATGMSADYMHVICMSYLALGGTPIMRDKGPVLVLDPEIQPSLSTFQC